MASFQSQMVSSLFHLCLYISTFSSVASFLCNPIHAFCPSKLPTKMLRLKTLGISDQHRRSCSLLRACESMTLDNNSELRQSIRYDTQRIQCWLEDLYDSVDYEAALERAGVLLQEDTEGGIETDDGENTFDSFENEDVKLTHQIETASADGQQCEGKEGEFTYGEMDLGYFISLLHRINPASSANFVDLGSGRGQLVLAAARYRKWRRCIGIEIMPEVFEIGRGALEIATRSLGQELSPCEFYLADIYNFTQPLADADLIFVYATCFPTSDGFTMSKLSNALRSSVKSGCIIITINKRLDETLGFHLLETLEGPNPDSVTTPAVAYIWRCTGKV